MADSVKVLVVEFTIEGTNHDDVEAFARALREKARRLNGGERFRSVALSESTEDISMYGSGRPTPERAP